ncbi:MAG: DUF4234 domain-containing protein [Frankiales bacterium]|nr:DUF4234 domain-containing protein [Frankiales bacterium]
MSHQQPEPSAAPGGPVPTGVPAPAQPPLGGAPAPGSEMAAYPTPAPPAHGSRRAGGVRPTAVKSRNVLAVWFLLPLITLGFYYWYWYPTINAELRDADPRVQVSPFVAWLAVVPGAFLVLPPFISMYNTGKRIATAQASAGIGSSCNPLIGVLLMFVFGLNTLYYQSELNKIPASVR